jgi:hypothetical protein
MALGVCRYCGDGRHDPERCARIAAIDYALGRPSEIVRVEFHPPTKRVGRAIDLSALVGLAGDEWADASTESLCTIEANECNAHSDELATKRFRRLFNEITRLARMLQEIAR